MEIPESEHRFESRLVPILNNFAADELKISGLFNNKNNFNFYRHKIIIPYLENDTITYLRGRYFYKGSCEAEKEIKYISPTNFAGNLSSKRFFNKDKLKEIHQGCPLLICEGEFDTILGEQCGNNCIGIAGISNFPKDDLNLLNNFRIYLAFDNDKPGRKARDETAALFNREIYSLEIKNYKDITELINGTRKSRFA